MGSLLRTDEELSGIYERNFDAVYRVCFLHLKNAADTEDMVQAAFVRLLETGKTFESPEHERAWLIRTATNLCINHLRHWWRRTVGIEHARGREQEGFEPDGTLEKVLALPAKYKSAIYLHYYEGYPAAQIAKILGVNESTVRGRLFTGRKLLRLELEDGGT